MPLQLARQQPVQGLVDSGRAAAPQQLAQLDLLVMPQASEHGSDRSHGDAVAAVAEIVRQGGDEAKTDPRPLTIIGFKRVMLSFTCRFFSTLCPLLSLHL
jgi:hypothetical protein